MYSGEYLLFPNGILILISDLYERKSKGIFLYVSINMSMVLGLLPIVGSPLPIMSYGGSSLLATMIGFSIVLSAKINHNQNIS